MLTEFMLAEFKIGDIVAWRNYARDRLTSVRHGVVVAIVPAGLDAMDVWLKHAIRKHQGINLRRVKDAGKARNHISYLVVGEPIKSNSKQPALYWPKVYKLEKSNAQTSRRYLKYL